MDKKFLIKLAFRNLMTHRLRTVLTLVGIVIGISAVVFLVSFGFGIQKLVTEQITTGDAFKLVDVGTGNSEIIKLNDALVDKVSGISNVSSVEKITNLAGKAKNDGRELDISFFAVSANYLEWTGRKITTGASLPKNIDGDKPIIVNTSFLLFYGDGDPQKYINREINLSVIVPKELSETDEFKTFSDQTYKIIGIIKDDSAPFAYTSVLVLPSYNVNQYSQLKVRINDQNQVPGIRKLIESFGLKTEYVGDTVTQVNQVFTIFKIILGSFGLIALLVALLGTFNTLTISLLERVKEVALLKMLGMSRKDIKNLFIYEAVCLGTFGGVLGLLLGLILSIITNKILNYFAVRGGGNAVSVFYYPLSFVFGIVAIALLIGFITGIYPARRAAKVNALDVLRYE
ncbi:MAG: ABC transporter permease [Candidatus Berkelbacteria bacterium]|nr:ABC transporter permease [Candidatus Berkelbacteria bacterium]